MRKSNRIQIAVSEKSAKTVRKMCMQKHKKCNKERKRKEITKWGAAVTQCILS